MDTWSAECLGCLRVPLLALPGLCRWSGLSHDRQFLQHPAIDIAWRWPCLPRFRLLRPLAVAVCLVVFKSWLVFGWFLNLSLQRINVMTLPGLDTGPIGLQHSSWVLALASRPMDVFVLSWCPCSLLCYSLLQYKHIPPSMSMVRIVLCMCSGNVLIGYVIFI